MQPAERQARGLQPNPGNGNKPDTRKGHRMNPKKYLLPAAVILGMALIAWPGVQEAETFLKGKVYYLDEANFSLGKKFEMAQKEFREAEKDGFYFTGYRFLSRDKLNACGGREQGGLISVTVKGAEIKMRTDFDEGAEKESHQSTKGSEPAGLVFLLRLTEAEVEIADIHFLDLDRTYAFFEHPIFWLGNAENEESLNFLANQLDEKAGDDMDSLVFAVYLHEHPQTGDKLFSIARGNHAEGVRKSAVFWLGNLRGDESLPLLKKIYDREEDTGLKEQVVFAIQLSDSHAAVRELIEIAKTERNTEAGKKAVFWLGQKASKECISALKDVIEDGEENESVKESAVFAVSQLPDDKAVPMLIDIAKKNKSPLVRKKAMFWLGQTGDVRALKFFEEILLKK